MSEQNDLAPMSGLEWFLSDKTSETCGHLFPSKSKQNDNKQTKVNIQDGKQTSCHLYFLKNSFVWNTLYETEHASV